MSSIVRGIHIHAPAADDVRIIRIDCPTCKRRSPAAAFHVEWYGWDETCLRCGDRWMDGEMLERPFMRAWRKHSIAEAKKRYRRHHPRRAA